MSWAKDLMPVVVRFAELLNVPVGAVYPIVDGKRVVTGWYVRDRGFYSQPHPASYKGRHDQRTPWVGAIVR